MHLTLTYPIKNTVSQRKDRFMIFVGIDISKLSFDVAVLIDGKYQSRQSALPRTIRVGKIHFRAKGIGHLFMESTLFAVIRCHR
jgi:hypothetical protein